MFKGQDLPNNVYIGGSVSNVQPYVPSNQCQQCWCYGHLLNIADLPHTALFVLHLVMITLNALQENMFVRTENKDIMSSTKAVLPTILNWRLLQSTSNMV